MEDIVDARHGIATTLQMAHIANEKLDFVGYIRIFGLILMAHIILLLLIARKDADLANIGPEETVQHSIAKRTCATCNQEGFICKYAHRVHPLLRK